MDKLIRLKATGNYLEFARILDISPAKLYRLIDLLKEDLSAPIIYNKQRGSFEYEREGCISLRFGLVPLDNGDMAGLTGGTGYNYSENIYLSHGVRNYSFNIDVEIGSNGLGYKTMLNLNY